MAEVQLFGYTAWLNKRGKSEEYVIGSLGYPGNLISCGDTNEIAKYQAFLEVVKIRLAELNDPRNHKPLYEVPALAD